MSILITGRIIELVILLIVSIITTYSIFRARTIGKLTLRKLPALDAIEESVGRAAEQGRPVIFTPGHYGLSHERGPQAMAGLNVLGYTARFTAKLGVPLITVVCQPDILPLATEIVRASYIAEGVSENFRPDDILFFPSTSFAMDIGYMGILQRRRPSTNIMMGPFHSGGLLIAEAGNTAGAVQIAGTAVDGILALFVVSCDYVLMPEELFAAGAYISRNPLEVGSIAGADLSKIVFIVLILVGVILAQIGSDLFVKLFKM